MELTKLGGYDDPLEGTNVTLICIYQTDGYNLKEQIKWSIVKESRETVALKATDLPKGMEGIAYYRRERLYNYSKFLLFKEWKLQKSEIMTMESSERASSAF